jgi:hypothetical protein
LVATPVYTPVVEPLKLVSTIYRAASRPCGSLCTEPIESSHGSGRSVDIRSGELEFGGKAHRKSC